MATETVQDPFLGMLKQGAHSAADVLMAMGIALVVLGAIALLAPLTSGLIFDILFGALLIGAGIVEFIDAFRSGSWQRGALLALAGVVTLAAGILYIARPLVGLVALTLVFIAYLVFLGAFRLVMSVQLPRGTPGKGMSFVSGLVALVLAFISIAELPSVSPWLIGTFIGVSLVFAGAARISVALGFRRAEHLMGPAPVHR
ncbi:MAG TPA: DUF308 domain-containing protein [Anaeromyxobacter sp.]